MMPASSAIGFRQHAGTCGLARPSRGPATPRCAACGGMRRHALLRSPTPMLRARLAAFAIAGLVACDEAAAPDDDRALALLEEVRGDRYQDWASNTIEGDAPRRLVGGVPRSRDAGRAHRRAAGAVARWRHRRL